MGVIGRLDDQVWKTIIEPIARRHERETQDEAEKQEAGREEEARAEQEKEETK